MTGFAPRCFTSHPSTDRAKRKATANECDHNNDKSNVHQKNVDVKHSREPVYSGQWEF